MSIPLSNMILKKENSVKFYIHKIDSENIPSKSMNVFYNKTMELNRDITNLAVMSYAKIYNEFNLNIVDCMAASGVGPIRMIKDCQNINRVYVNDINPLALDLIRKNFSLNRIDPNKVSYSQKDANLLLLSLKDEKIKPEIISIDPFGTPNIYLDAVFKTIQKVRGLICITATDTPVLFGIRKNACMRKYLAKALRVEYSKEIGARILLHFISRIANVNDLGIIPVLTYYSNHFIRVFALTFKNKEKISQFFINYGYILHCDKCGMREVVTLNDINLNLRCKLCNNKYSYAGPLWKGKMHDHLFIEQMLKENEKLHYKNKKRISKSLKIILKEIGMPLSYYNIHKLTKELNLSSIPKQQNIIQKVKELAYKATRTHFDPLSIKTDMDLLSLKKILNQN